MFTLKFSTANEAFADDAPEVARILSQIASRVLGGVRSGSIQDVNGNTVGKWELQ